MKWIKYSSHNPPPQGMKILCFNQGDLWVSRRLRYKNKDYYLEIPYGGNWGAILTNAPDYWMCLDLPEGYTGKMRVKHGDSIIDFDELEDIDHEKHETIIKMFLSSAMNKDDTLNE